MEKSWSEENLMVAHARIVFVKSRSHLQNTMGHDCRYRTADGHSLVPGYWYLVSWPGDIEEPLFDGRAHYAGPYDSEAAAKNALATSQGPSSREPEPSLGACEPRQLAGNLFTSDWHGGH